MVELAFVLPLAILLFAGGIAFAQIYTRLEALSDTASYAARRAAIIQRNADGSFPTVINSDVAALLSPLMSVSDLQVSVTTDPPMAPGNPADCLHKRVHVQIIKPVWVANIPFWGKLTVPLQGDAFAACERD